MPNIVTVNFRNDTLFAVERGDGKYVAIKPICESLGLDWNGQRQRIHRDGILSEGAVMITLPSVGGAQETLCLPIEMVNGWLFSVDDRRIKDEMRRRKVMQYKRECYQALFEHFYGKKMDAIATDEETREAELPKMRMITECRQIFGARAAGQLWMQLSLPVVPDMLQASQQLSFIDYKNVKTVDQVS